jgi:hypothetical protein
MIKIPCLFERDFTDRRRPVLLRTVSLGCEWVLAGEGMSTRKRDGTACLVQAGKLYRRYDVRTKRGGIVPVGAIACIPEADPVTGHWPHWLEVDSSPECKWHSEAWSGLRASDGSRFRPKATLADGTYELCGPKINGNAEALAEHEFFRHGAEHVEVLDRSWDGLRALLNESDIEGIVFHHERGMMCKIRRDDYGFPWPVERVISRVM